MRRRDGSMPLPVALLGALLLHGLGFAALVPAIAGDAAPRGLESHLEPDPHERPDEERELQLGIDADTPSSLTWIGYADFQEQLARLGEVEQAAFRADPSGGDGGVEAPSIAAAPAGAETASTAEAEVESSAEVAAESPPAAEASAEAAAEATAIEDPATAETDPPELPLEGTPPEVEAEATDAPPAEAPAESSEPDRAAPAPPLPTAPLPALPSPPTLLAPADPDAPDAAPPAAPLSQQLLEQWLIVRSPAEAAPAQAAAQEAPSEADEGAARPAVDQSAEPPAEPSAAAKPSPRSAESATESRAGEPATPPAGAAAAGESAAADTAPGTPTQAQTSEGEEADRESDASSIVDVPPDQWRLGRPLAARGLDIRTRRPVFTELTRLTSAPRNPVVEIRFGRDGVPRLARILRSSGDPRVDGPIVDALYRWRASGTPLEELRGDQTVGVEMRIIIVAE